MPNCHTQALTVQEQPREKLLKTGAGQLSDRELLAVFLGSGLPGRPVLQLAQNLLTHFGTLAGVLTAPASEFCAVPGLGQVRYCQLQAAREIICRACEKPLAERMVLNDVAEVSRFLQIKMLGLEQEVFALLLLDSQHQLIVYRPMFSGTINSAAVYPRELVKQALKDNAAAVILVHNHPSGVAEPSQADVALTKEVVAAMALVDISVLDHFIVGAGYVVSLSQRGLM